MPQMFAKLLENSLIRQNIVKESAERREQKKKAMIEEHNEIADDLYTIREAREMKHQAFGRYKTMIKEEALRTELEALYISALQKVTYLSEEDYMIAKNLVDHYIKEQGVDNILIRMSNKTPLLEAMRSYVQEAEDEAIDAADDEAIATNTNPEDITGEEIVNKMEDTPESDTAVVIIAKRISDTESDFIKQNAEEKQKIEDIVNTSNDKVEAVKKDPTKTDEEKQEVEAEQTREMKRKINAITENSYRNIFDTLVHQVTESVFKDENLKNTYVTENGSIDIDKVIATSRDIYGFLETVNTIQLERVDKNYLKNLVENF